MAICEEGRQVWGKSSTFELVVVGRRTTDPFVEEWRSGGVTFFTIKSAHVQQVGCFDCWQRQLFIGRQVARDLSELSELMPTMDFPTYPLVVVRRRELYHLLFVRKEQVR